MSQRRRFIADLGVTPEKIAALATGAAHAAFTPLERAVLAFTDDVVTNVRASDATLSELCNHLPPRQVVELIMTAGCYRMLCMMLESCGVEIEDEGEAHRMSQADWQSRMQHKQPPLPE